MNDWNVVAEWMRRRRIELGLTVKQAAARAGISEPQWDVMENARRDSFRERSLRGVERALMWPSGGIDELLSGQAFYEPPVQPEQFNPPPDAAPTVIELPIALDEYRRTLADRILMDQVLDQTYGPQPGHWRAQLVRRAYTLTLDGFLRWFIRDLAEAAAMEGELDGLRFTIEATIHEVLADFDAEINFDPADFLEAAAQDDDSLDDRTETPPEENPEV